jgi:hypothetical protein
LQLFTELIAPSPNAISIKGEACYIRDTPILSSERMLYKDYARKGHLVVNLKRLGANTN